MASQERIMESVHSLMDHGYSNHSTYIQEHIMQDMDGSINGTSMPSPVSSVNGTRLEDRVFVAYVAFGTGGLIMFGGFIYVLIWAFSSRNTPFRSYHWMKMAADREAAELELVASDVVNYERRRRNSMYIDVTHHPRYTPSNQMGRRNSCLNCDHHRYEEMERRYSMMPKHKCNHSRDQCAGHDGIEESCHYESTRRKSCSSYSARRPSPAALFDRTSSDSGSSCSDLPHRCCKHQCEFQQLPTSKLLRVAHEAAENSQGMTMNEGSYGALQESHRSSNIQKQGLTTQTVAQDAASDDHTGVCEPEEQTSPMAKSTDSRELLHPVIDVGQGPMEGTHSSQQEKTAGEIESNVTEESTNIVVSDEENKIILQNTDAISGCHEATGLSERMETANVSGVVTGHVEQSHVNEDTQKIDSSHISEDQAEQTNVTYTAGDGVEEDDTITVTRESDLIDRTAQSTEIIGADEHSNGQSNEPCPN